VKHQTPVIGVQEKSQSEENPRGTTIEPERVRKAREYPNDKTTEPRGRPISLNSSRIQEPASSAGTARLRLTYPLLDLLGQAVAKCEGFDELQRQSGIQRQSVWRWLNEIYETIPLTAVLKCCEICGKQLLNYVDPRLSALLWLQRLVTTGQLVKLRGSISPRILQHATNLSSPYFSEPVPCGLEPLILQLSRGTIF